MSLRRYKYFQTVARHGSIRAASKALHVAPSAISRQIAKLEQELGIGLFEPHGRGIRITTAGELLARRASDIVNATESAKSDINDLLGLRRGHVRIRTVEGSLSDWVLPAMERMHRRHPAITFDLSITSTDRIVSAVLEGEADIGVAFNPPQHPDLTEVASVPDSVYAVVHPRYAGLRRRSTTLEEAAQQPIALPDQTFGLRHMVDAAAKLAGVTLAPLVLTDSIDALRGFARSGLGVVFLPRLAIATDLRRRTLRAIPLADKTLKLAITTVIVRRQKNLANAARSLGEELAAVARWFRKGGSSA